MPDPKPNESRDDYMDRCMGDDKMVEQFGNPKQRAAVCNSYFEEGKAASEEYEDWGENATAAEYKGRSVTLNKPFRTPNESKKFGVYVKNPSGRVIIVRFGDPNMEIKRDDPKRRKAFRDRHNCDTATDKTTPRYWSCRQWESGRRVEAEFSVCASCETQAACAEAENCMGNAEAQKDPRSTPAPPKDRKKGSKRNKPGSAKPGGKITFSESVTKSLQKKVKEHNEKSDRKVTLGKLKAVYRRGAGAYSTSHRPGVSRAAWSMARVNAFLTLVRRGRPANPKYTQDNDLLPSNHPRASEELNNHSEDLVAMGGCDCDCDDNAIAERNGEMYDNPGEAMDRAKEMGCNKIHTHDIEGKTMFMPCGDMEEYREKMKEASYHDKKKYMASDEDEWYDDDEIMEMMLDNAEAKEHYNTPTPKSDETHKEYMDRCMAMGNSEAACKIAHEGHKFKDQDKPHTRSDHEAKHKKDHEEDKYGYAEEISVTIDLDVSDVVAVVEATTKQTILEIRGIAFHEGMNKNKWSLTREGAEIVVEQMVGADVTLNHPKAREEGAGFTRNMNGDVDEAVVGVVKQASIRDLSDGRWEVTYVAHVIRTELFSALESGLWNRENYGVSIGGTGIPVSSSEDGIVFGERFRFDHLAIVHKPAYPRANIESVKRIKAEKVEMKASEMLNYDSILDQEQQQVIAMTDEEMNDANSEIEALKAQLVLANARVNEFEAAEEARAEEVRMELVSEASELGMSGHDDLSTDTLKSLIASWRESHPDPEPVEMAPVAEPEVASEEVIASEKPTAVVSNYLNGKLVETDAKAYEKAWNAWASAWNKTLAVAERDSMRAPSFEERMEMI